MIVLQEVFVFLVVCSVSSGLGGRWRFGTGSTSCPVPPHVVGLSAADLRPALVAFNSSVAAAVNSEGPAVAVSVIFNQDVVFSNGYGLINISGEDSVSSAR